MLFCPECGMLIRKFVERDGKIIGMCINGHETIVEPNSLKIATRISQKHETTITIEEERLKPENYNTTSIPCPHCGSKNTKLLHSFVPYGDEEQVNIMKCLKCNRNFRVGMGVSGV